MKQIAIVINKRKDNTNIERNSKKKILKIVQQNKDIPSLSGILYWQM